MSTIGERLEAEWDAFARHLPGSHYHDRQYPATPAPEAPVSLITEVKAELKSLAAKAEGIDEAAVGKVEALEGNPVVDALLAAVHVPVNALSIVVDVLNGLAAIYPKPADAPADPAMGQPEPAPAA
jgi:hypothetical protein